MATLNLSTNGPAITKSYQNVVNAAPPSGPQAKSPTYGQWAIFVVTAPLVSAFQQDAGKESVMKVQSTGEGELLDLIEEFSDGRIQFAFVKVKDPNTTLPKSVLIAWCGEGVPERTKGYFTSHLAAASKLLHGYHVQITARSDRDLTPEGIIQKVADSSGSKYSGGPNVSQSSAGPPPPVASKPVFTPSSVGSSNFKPLSGRSRGNVGGATDSDGWGNDAPPVTRTQLEKVESAYKPTKVNMSELVGQKQTPSQFSAPRQAAENPSVIGGGYQPIGKVDIAEIRRQAQQSGSARDDRPEPVKGAYEPIGKVDIAAIRAKAQVPSPGVSQRVPPAAEDDSEAPKSLADRSAAFNQSERLTTLPKPKVANKFGGASAFTGTKAPAPGGFQSKSITSTAPVGVASKTFADEGGKTPAQLWAEKKAREGGSVPSSSVGLGTTASPVQTQASGDGGWKSSYTGKTWAPVQTTKTGQSATSNSSDRQATDDLARENEQHESSGGVSAMRDRFKGAVPMGKPSMTRDVSDDQAPHPPPMDMASKPNVGAARGVPMPGLASRPSHNFEDDVPSEQTVNVPTPPRVQRSPSPPTPPEMRSGSPIQVAMPVGRGAESAVEPVEEPRQALPTESIAKVASANRNLSPEPAVQDEHPARAAAAASVGGAAAASSGGKRAVAQYDYEKAEDNEIELREGEIVTDIDMVDDDWWMGTNSQGESGLFPSNYVELVEDDGSHEQFEASHAEAAPPAGPPAPTGAPEGPTATAQYDYEAAEENELSFPDGATITGVEFPDEDWWLGHYNGKSGLFPANYVQLNE